MSTNAPTIEPVGDCLTPEVAERLISLRATPELQQQVDALAEKANQGTLSEEERDNYEQYVSFSQFITLLQLQARSLLDGGPSQA